jgi:adenylate cyclase
VKQARGDNISADRGDGALIEFASAVDAVECAVAFQEAMADHNGARPDREPIEFRIGVNLGDIVVEGGDIFGDGVNVAVRLEGQAPKAGILVSDAVHAQIKGKVSAVFRDAGEPTLKILRRPSGLGAGAALIHQRKR